MFRAVGGTLVLLLALPALGYQEKDKDKPATPEQQYQALLKEQNDAMTSFQKAYRQAKTQKEKDKLVKEKYPTPEKAAAKFLELAEKNPKDPAAVDALIWVVMRINNREEDSPRTKALDVLLRDHVQSDKMGQVCQSLVFRYGAKETKLLHAILDKNPNKEAQGEACLALGQQLGRAARLVRNLKDEPERLARVEQFLGKEIFAELRKKGSDKLEAEGVQYYKDFGSKYASQMKADKLIQLCQRLGRLGDGGAEPLLRMLMEQDARRDVQGVACLALAQSLKSVAEDMPEAKAKDADKLRRQSAEMFDHATNKYGDVKLRFGGTIGESAKSDLYELRHLSIGMTGPDIVGEDADSKSFKLSDYRGKVVLLDFWGHW